VRIDHLSPSEQGLSWEVSEFALSGLAHPAPQCQPQTAQRCFVSGLKSRLSCYRDHIQVSLREQGLWSYRKTKEKDIMSDNKNHICSVTHAGSLDNRIRRWLQDPRKILGPYIKEGMIVLDMGCGPGFFSIELARLVGKSGKVIASDLQEGMLEIIRKKIQGTELYERIILHKCEKDKIGLSEHVDFVLAFYMLHEVPNQEEFFKEIKSTLKPNGQVFIVEPPFHVSKNAFEETIRKARDAGFMIVERPRLFLNKAVILQKG
jgi:2-polyprenyl-3-methyl-5-hydroxy-6-metoxy-1,4-benzoquinol methylase